MSPPAEASKGPSAPAILVADDDRDICAIVVEEFHRLGYRNVRTATSVAAALGALRSAPVDLAIIDLNFTPDGREGLQLISHIHQDSPETYIVVLSVVDSPADIVDAVQRGARDYIVKDAIHVELSTQIDGALRECIRRIGRNHVRQVEQHLSARQAAAVLVGESENIRRIRAAVHGAHGHRISRFVVVGDSGSGKRAVADYIIATDPSYQGQELSALTFNCGSTMPELARSELFGIAQNSGLPNVPAAGKPGAFALARGGYLVIDDFHDLPPELYRMFLQVLERDEVKPQGGASCERVEYRLIVTTQRPLSELPAQLRRRLELNSEILELLPLAKRREDILPLAHHYLATMHAEGRIRRHLRLAPEVERALVELEYEANVGDLHRLLFRLALAEVADEISEATLLRVVPDAVRRAEPMGQLEEAERLSIEEAINASAGDVRRAARALGIDHQAVRRRAAKYGIDVGRRWEVAHGLREDE